jgi:hypothetical protein
MKGICKELARVELLSSTAHRKCNNDVSKCFKYHQGSSLGRDFTDPETTGNY